MGYQRELHKALFPDTDSPSDSDEEEVMTKPAPVAADADSGTQDPPKSSQYTPARTATCRNSYSSIFFTAV